MERTESCASEVAIGEEASDCSINVFDIHQILAGTVIVRINNSYFKSVEFL